MNRKDRAVSALMAVFPTSDSFTRFAARVDNQASLQSFVSFAYDNDIIPDVREASLDAFIAANARSEEICTPPNHLSFDNFFDQKEVLLELTLSARALVERINSLIKECRIDLPKATSSMLTRLKKEPADTVHKQNVLRSLAFWLGHDRPQLGPIWNFETLVQLCRGGKSAVDHKEGVRIGFALYSRGDVIDHETVGWLKKELKSYIDQSLGRFLYGRWGKVRFHDITTLYVDFPKESKLGNPAAYRHCLRSALSLAHQMAIRWALSPYCTQNRFMSIGLAAGGFANLDNYLLPLLNAKLPGDPVIRFTDYARQCILINDIRALLSSRPSEITLFNGETLTIWWVVSVWSMLYFDFIPDLLDDPFLQNDALSAQRLVTKLWSSTADDSGYEPEDQRDAITSFFRFPHNSLLGLEIAKTLYYRRRFWDAIEILKTVLSLDPTHLSARTLRMVLLRNLATEAPSYSIAEGMFAQSHLEAEFIRQNCAFQSEDFYCEHAVVYLAEAMATLRYLRSGAGQFDSTVAPGSTRHLRSRGAIDAAAAPLYQKVFDCLEHADRLFESGIMVSPTGIRSTYLISTVKVLAAVLKNDPAIFNDPVRPIDGPPETVLNTTDEYRWQLGFRREDLAMQQPHVLLDKIINFQIIGYDDSIALQAYRPTTFFCTAVTWWDLFPVRTVKTARRTLKLLKGAAEIAASMDKSDICIYSFTRTYGEMIPTREFLHHVDRSVRMVEELAGGDLHKRDENEIIPFENDRRMGLLMTLNF
ncbi:MAG: hypothetical protein ACLQVJ_15420 [Syntrophobacteraceae bacterium]